MIFNSNKNNNPHRDNYKNKNIIMIQSKIIFNFLKMLEVIMLKEKS